MKLIIQRVSSASVTVADHVVGEIHEGILAFLGITHTDTQKDSIFLIDKLLHLRIFNDISGKMDKSVKDIQGGILVVSQFTLYGDCRKGRRPSYTDAAKQGHAEPLYQYFLDELSKKYPMVKSGIFGANMKVALVNDGPVTLALESTPKKEPY